ncbi:MAG TPA: Rieske (2Fe-2S) protein [Polyangiaceae bacterium]|nr:Rieske (2Fe-2S) protein [Polyangiaceae bacterium]
MEVTLGPITAIPEGEGRSFQVGAAQIAVFRSRDGGLFATQADCPHRQGPLADGLLGSGTLICPLHSLKFDLSTGRAENGDCSLKTYPARLSEGGQILVDLRGAP